MVTCQPSELNKLIPRGANYSYDVEVFVGIERYMNYRQREEIQSKLKMEHGIQISTGEISNLSKRFLIHLEALHLSCSNALKMAMQSDGGYPLNIDATGEAGSGTLFVAYNSWREWVLGAWSLSTECADQIKPCLVEVVDRFGLPCAIMRDLGKAVIPAVNSFVDEVNEDIEILGCHSHFLKDIGRDLLTPSYDDLRNLLRSYGIITSVRSLVREWGKRLGIKAKETQGDIKKWADNAKDHQIPDGDAGLAILRSMGQWILDYSNDNENLRFPFDRPYLDFLNRCKVVRRAIDAYLRSLPNDPDIIRILKRFAKVIDPVISDRKFNDICQRLSKRTVLFDKLRKALRLDLKANAGKKDHSKKSEQQKASEINDIQRSIEAFKQYLIKIRPKRGPDEDIRKAIDIIETHLERHGTTLWGQIISLPDHAGGGIRVICRTNNGIELKFGGIKRGERRRSGRKNLTQDMENLPPESMFVSNLKHQDYVEILCGSLDRLPEVFADLDIQNNIKKNENLGVTKNIREIERIETASLSKSDIAFIRKISIEKSIMAAASSRAPRIDLSHCQN